MGIGLHTGAARGCRSGPREQGRVECQRRDPVVALCMAALSWPGRGTLPDRSHAQIMAAGSVFLACKVDESPRALRDVAFVYYKTKNANKPEEMEKLRLHAVGAAGGNAHAGRAADAACSLLCHAFMQLMESCAPSSQAAWHSAWHRAHHC